MGLFQKLGLPNADRLDEQVRTAVNPLQSNPLTGALRGWRLIRAGKLGRMPIPGEITLLLRPGKLRLTYQERGTGGMYSGTKGYSAPRPPGLEVRPAGGGEPLPLAWIPGTNAIRNGFGNKTTALLAEVEIPATSEYTVRAPQPVPDMPVIDGTRKRQGTQLLFDA